MNTNGSALPMTLFAGARAYLLNALLLVSALSGLGWSSNALAIIGCEIQPNGATTQSGPTGSTLTFKFDIVDLSGGCAATVSGTISQTFDSTGGASAQTTWSGAPGATISVVVTLGPTSGGNANYSVDCPVSDCTGGNSNIGWTAQTDDSYSLTADAPSSRTILTGQYTTINAHYLKNGTDANNSTNWNVSPAGPFFSFSNPVFTDDSTGLVTNDLVSYSPGTFTVTVDPEPTECGALCPAQVSYSVTVEAPLLSTQSPATGAATISTNSSTTLSVKFSGATLPVADGTNIDWSITSEPSVGAGTFTPALGGPPSFARTTTSGGIAQVDLGVTVPGTYTIDAGYCPDGCNQTVTFTITVPVPVPALSATKVLTSNADGDNSGTITVGDVLTYTVTATNSGNVGLNNVQVFDPLTAPTDTTCATLAVNATCVLTGTYVVTSADVTAGTISNTGRAQSNELPVGVFSNTVNTPVAGSPVLTVAKILVGYADNDNTDSISKGDLLTFSVTAHNSGSVALTNVQVSDPMTSPASATCANLAINGNCVLTGTYTVSAADVEAGSISNTGSAHAAEAATPVEATLVTAVAPTVRTLAIVSGSGQTGTPGSSLPQPFVVQAFDNGLPAPGVGIDWTIVSGNGSMSPASSNTAGNGVSSSSLKLSANPGTVTVMATRQDTGSVTGPLVPTSPVSVTFTVNSALLGNLPGLDPKAKAIADAFDKFCSKMPESSSNSDVTDLHNRCQDLINSIYSDPDGVVNALDELFPDLGLVLSETSLLAAEAQFDNIKARIAALRSGTQGVSFGGLALSTGRGSLPIGLAFQSLLDGDNTGDKPGTEVGSDFSRWGFFAAGSIGRGKTDPGQISPGYDLNINGLTVGADYRKSDRFILGGTLGYTHQNNDLVSGRGKLDTQGYSVSAFSTYYKDDSWYLDDVFSYGRNSYDMIRSVRYTIIQPGGATTLVDQTSHGSSNGNSLTFATSVGRDFNRNGLNFGPYLRAIYSRQSFDPLTEHFEAGKVGSGLGMVIDTHDVTSVTSTLGAKLTYTHSTSWGVLIPHLQAEWQHEFKSDPSSLTAYFLNDPTATPFTVIGDPIDTDFYRLGVGLSFVLTHGRSGFFYYEKLIGRDRVARDSLAFGLRLEF